MKPFKQIFRTNGMRIIPCLLLIALTVSLVSIPSVFAEQVIFSEGKEYEIGEITEVRKYKLSPITKTQGYTTTGDMFFWYTSSDFEKVMFLTRDGQWQKAEMREKIILKPQIIKPTTIETIIEEPKYIPNLIMTSSHDFRTYWKDTFNIDVQTYDGNINKNPQLYPFEGKMDNVNVSVLLSLNDVKVATLSGVTQYGEWKGSYFFDENISEPGEYVVDIIVSYLGETVSKSSTFFVIATILDSSSTNNDRDGDGILNIDDACPDDADDFLGAGESNPPPIGDGCPEP